MVKRSLPRPVVVTVVLGVLVVAGVLVAAFVLRPESRRAEAPQVGVAKPTAESDTTCGSEQCRVIAHIDVGGLGVDLLSDSEGGSGKLRAGGLGSSRVSDTTITTMGAELNNQSLRCLDTGDAPVCLVRGPHDGGMVAEAQVWTGHGWRDAGQPYFSDAGSVVLDDVADGGMPEVVVVRHDCGGDDSAAECQQAPVLAEAYDLGGGALGCTTTYGSPGEFTGWPEVSIDDSELAACD